LLQLATVGRKYIHLRWAENYLKYIITEHYLKLRKLFTGTRVLALARAMAKQDKAPKKDKAPLKEVNARAQPKRHKAYHGFRSLVLAEFAAFGPPLSFRFREAEAPAWASFFVVGSVLSSSDWRSSVLSVV
jgi:hypothetical protein